jgi:transcriptional regulator with XRE-family HTH domain
MSFKTNLKIELFYNDKTLKELAAEVGVSYACLCNYTGKRSVLPNVEIGCKIAKALGVSAEYLCTGNDKIVKSDSIISSVFKEFVSLPKKEQKLITDLIHEFYKKKFAD